MNNPNIYRIDVAAIVEELDAAREYIKELLTELRAEREHGKELEAIVRDLANVKPANGLYGNVPAWLVDLIDRARTALEAK